MLYSTQEKKEIKEEKEAIHGGGRYTSERE